MSEYRKVPCVIQRGGTSKGVYLHEKDLPKDPDLRQEIILSIFGSPDIRQIDGLGGADPLTSKCAVIGPSERPDADVNYTMAQVGITDALIDFRGNCGNISAGVGPFAIDEGLVEVREPETIVRIYNTNTKKILEGLRGDGTRKIEVHRRLCDRWGPGHGQQDTFSTIRQRAGLSTEVFCRRAIRWISSLSPLSGR